MLAALTVLPNKTFEYSAACCRSTHVLGGECSRISVGTVLPQLALWDQSFLHLVFSQRLDKVSPHPLDFHFLLSKLAGMDVNGSEQWRSSSRTWPRPHFSPCGSSQPSPLCLPTLSGPSLRVCTFNGLATRGAQPRP